MAEDAGAGSSEGARRSKRRRTPNIRIVNDLEPSADEQQWGRGRGRRATRAEGQPSASASEPPRGVPFAASHLGLHACGCVCAGWTAHDHSSLRHAAARWT